MLNQENMPGAGSVADTLAFMKQMWSGMGTPPMTSPSLSVDDLNKKISDLKTVASWLELNMNMLRATIQTLEVQSATLTTLQAMGAILSSRQADAPASPNGAQNGAGGDGAAPVMPPFPFGFPMWPGVTPSATADSDGTDEEAARAEENAEPEVAEDEPDPSPASASAHSAAEAAADTAKPQPAAGIMPDLQSAMANPNAWWNMLQQQFTQAVGNAMADGAGAEAPSLKPRKPGKDEEKGKGAAKSKSKLAPATAAPAARGRVAKAPAPKAAVGKAAPKKITKAPQSSKAGAKASVVQSGKKMPAPVRKPKSPRPV
ncbi:pilus assembly protein FimV [Herbaspirillum lusitanum]|uniref:Pilus assembly protein FimV n=1 Tax=Herbaspirillum lusitanum TaxID=213312 RepID=A0ABW9AGG2_9BURK